MNVTLTTIIDCVVRLGRMTTVLYNIRKQPPFASATKRHMIRLCLLLINKLAICLREREG